MMLQKYKSQISSQFKKMTLFEDKMNENSNESNKNSSKTEKENKKFISDEENIFDIKKGVTIYLKILLNYLQLISIIQNFDLKWPFYVKEYLNIYSSVGNLSDQSISFECLLADYGISVQPIYFQTFFMILIPFITYLFSFILLYIKIVIFHKNRKELSTKFIVILIVSSIFLQPNLIKFLYKNLICKKIDDDYLLIQNYNINCNSDTHSKWYFLLFYFFKLAIS